MRSPSRRKGSCAAKSPKHLDLIAVLQGMIPVSDLTVEVHNNIIIGVLRNRAQEDDPSRMRIPIDVAQD